jgi:hypothetical protein
MRWKGALSIAIASCLGIEIVQRVLHIGVFDIDDVILNVLGVMIGYGAYLLGAKWAREKKYTHIFVSIAVVVAMIIGTLYAMFPHSQTGINPTNTSTGRVETTSDFLEPSQTQGEDPCGGMGGNEIIDKQEGTITIRK